MTTSNQIEWFGPFEAALGFSLQTSRVDVPLAVATTFSTPG